MKALEAFGDRHVGYRNTELGSVRWRDVAFDDESTGERIDPRTLSIALDDLLPAERVIAVDSGNFMGYPSACLSVPDENGFCFTQAFQSIGLGLATAIGAALAQPDRRVLVTLIVAGQLCGVPVMAVRDVLGEQAITPVPLAPAEIAGNLNLRGRIVTAIDLRRRLGLPGAEADRRPMSVVAEQGSEYYALLVDEVGEVLTLEASLYERTPPTLPASFAAFAEGVFRLPERLLMVLSVPRLLDIRATD